MSAAPVTIPRARLSRVRDELNLAVALIGAAFRRQATYRQAILAAAATNSVFGFLRCFVLLSAASSATATGRALTGGRGDTTVVLTTHDLADIERLCRRLVDIDHGHVVHDGTLDSLPERYGSQRTVVVTIEEPLASPVLLPGVELVSTSVDGIEDVIARLHAASAPAQRSSDAP